MSEVIPVRIDRQARLLSDDAVGCSSSVARIDCAGTPRAPREPIDVCNDTFPDETLRMRHVDNHFAVRTKPLARRTLRQGLGPNGAGFTDRTGPLRLRRVARYRYQNPSSRERSVGAAVNTSASRRKSLRVSRGVTTGPVGTLAAFARPGSPRFPQGWR